MTREWQHVAPAVYSAPPPPKVWVVYKLSRAGRPVYVGITNRLAGRLTDHFRGATGTLRKVFDRVDTLSVDDEQDARHVEQYLIKTLRPRCNNQAMPAKGRSLLTGFQRDAASRYVPGAPVFVLRDHYAAVLKAEGRIANDLNVAVNRARARIGLPPLCSEEEAYGRVSW